MNQEDAASSAPTNSNAQQRLSDIQNKSWLVKSSNKIWGPYSFEEVAEKLLSGEFSLIDEIRSPDRRWTYIRDHSEFLNVAARIRLDSDKKNEDTATSTVTITMQTRTQTMTQTRSQVTNTINKELEALNQKYQEESQKTQPRVIPASVGSVEASKNSKKPSTLVWLILILIVVVIADFFYIRQSRTKPKVNPYQEYIGQAMLYKQMRFYHEAAEAVKTASQYGSLSAEIEYEMAPLFINIMGENLRGRKAIESVISQGTLTQQQIAEQLNYTAISHLIEGDLTAAESDLNRASAYDPNNVAAQLNSAQVKFFKSSYQEAYDQFSNLLKSSESGLAQIGRALAALELYRKKSQSIDLAAVRSDLRRFAQINFKDRVQANLLDVILSRELKSEDYIGRLDNFFDEDLFLYEKHVHSLNVFHQIERWDQLCLYVEDIYKAESKSPRIKGLKAFCLMHTNQPVEALNEVTEALKITPYDEMLQALQFQIQLNREEKNALAGVFQVQPHVSKIIFHLLRAESCRLGNNLKCVRENFEEVLNVDPNHVDAQYGISKANFEERGDRAQTLQSVKKGLEISPDYLALLKLRYEIENAK